jgi:Flp pilus assembly protein TadD
LKIAPGNPDTKRTLAVLLAAQPDQKAWREANSLLEYSSPGAGADPTNLRLQAAILARRGRPADLKKARQLLESLVADPRTAISDDRLNLAKIYESLGDLPAARKQLKSEADQYPDDASRWMAYIDFLLRQNDVTEAERCLKRLESAGRRDLNTLDMRARWLQAAGRAEEIEALIEPQAHNLISTIKQPAEMQRVIQSIAGIYSRLGRSTAAERWLRRLAKDFPDQYAPLVRWLVQQQRVDAAADLCLEAVQREKSPQAVTLLAEVLVSAAPQLLDEPSMESALAGAVQQHPDDADLLLAVSNLRLVQQRLDEAADLLQRVTEIRTDDFLAWNNLAAILAERPDQRQRALQCIDRAISLAGRPIASLLDTKAHILVQRGRFREAIILLEEVVAAADGDDPRFYFHLSVAYERIGTAEKAREALQKARELGLSNNYLTPLEKDQLANLDTRLAL